MEPSVWGSGHHGGASFRCHVENECRRERRELARERQECVFKGRVEILLFFKKSVSVRNVGVKSRSQGLKKWWEERFISSAIHECLEVRERGEIRWWLEGAMPPGVRRKPAGDQGERLKMLKKRMTQTEILRKDASRKGDLRTEQPKAYLIF